MISFVKKIKNLFYKLINKKQKIIYFEVLDEDDESLPVLKLTKESLIKAGYSEDYANFIMNISEGKIKGCCVDDSLACEHEENGDQENGKS